MIVQRFGSAVRVHTPAKLNLFLEILGRRDDGFHEIETLIAAISVYDTLDFVVEPEQRELHLECRWAAGLSASVRRAAIEDSAGQNRVTQRLGDLPPSSQNLVLRIVERLRERAGVERGATIRLTKRIPSAAGLGGASSDAAAVLVAANEAWQLGWSVGRLAALGAELGSDIPFFFYTGAAGPAMAICRGRGELIEPVAHSAQLPIVVVRPPGGLSTAAVYGACRPAEKARDVRPLLDAVRRGSTAQIAARLSNRLQPAAEQLSPWIVEMRRMFDRAGCLGHQMSGSGTSYFGICRHARHARRVAAFMRSADCGVVYCASSTAAARRYGSG